MKEVIRSTIELEGTYGKATIFTTNVDNTAKQQVQNLLEQPYAENAHIRMMPDIHAGAGCTIGTTMKIHDKICPNLVGVDIGCGVTVTKLADKEIDLDALDQYIRAHIPSGKNIYDVYPPLIGVGCRLYTTQLKCVKSIDEERACKSVGTLGGGNHFIEVDKDSEGYLYLVIHSGSRHLGLEVAKYYQNLAYNRILNNTNEIAKIISDLKAKGQEYKIEGEIQRIKASKPIVTKDLAYLTADDAKDYLHDIDIIQDYAQFNRTFMINKIVRNLNLHPINEFTSVHNYIDEKRVLRKGAIAAHKYQKVIIPMNMRDGSLICIGKGNAEWNCSAPHGAGRLMSRKQAKDNCSMSDYRASMNGVFSTCINEYTLDEAPMAYKPMDEIIKNIEPTVDILKVIKPIYNFKAD